MSEKSFEQIYADYKAAGEQQALQESAGAKRVLSPDSDKERIVAVRKNDDGDLIAFKTSNGRELDYVTALQEAKAGQLAHVDVFHKYGRDILRSEPDGIKENNLDQLPIF
ncbi:MULTISPECIES: DUF3892 domain-containing protein [Brevibacillus]|uniref:DUF3892 domain-containing protein n=1 Tax=Brevibacillus TaxID=55080 RepID=UPI000271B332|nr:MULTISPECIES: DUF3892 domain-containing protein [Brevibacillus]EJL43200.1 hypothetical protein PMI08_02744 [Brevibacillus sp. CF112]MBG9566005.1 hypothetical protein [Brevibacillus agri]MDN4092066.1 DUF3892 domain-containing protein [Brevibacillus agri]MDR9504888.1 DUF3892 domain-containing protein [Brevibacillus agri]MED1824531.1 DUF3892 domain-containing protein [Brevibacillus agri]